MGISKGVMGEYKMWRLESLSLNVDRDWSEFVNQVAGRVSDCILGTYKFLLDEFVCGFCLGI